MTGDIFDDLAELAWEPFRLTPEYKFDDLYPETRAHWREAVERVIAKYESHWVHASDCELFNEPALPMGLCSCQRRTP